MDTARLRHPNVHAAWSQWSEDQTLHVVAVYSNPFRYRTRRELFHNFADHMAVTPNVRFYTTEVAFGRRPFEVTEPDNPQHLQLRSTDAIWHKEAAINATIRSRFPIGWQYGGYSDGDFHFTRHDWALEAIHQLQHYPMVQLYSSYNHMSLDHRPIRNSPGFAYVYRNYPNAESLMVADAGSAVLPRSTKVPPNAVCGHSGVPPNAVPKKQALVTEKGHALKDNATRRLIEPGATGGAWAFRQEAFRDLGGLLDICVTGSCDWHMAFGMTGEIIDQSKIDPNMVKMLMGELSMPEYGAAIQRWQRRAYQVIKGNLGYVDQLATHSWHGSYGNRGYGTRWQILRRYGFDPNLDIVRDHQGLWQWSGDKPQLEQAMAKYFTTRNEDSTEMGSEVPLL